MRGNILKQFFKHMIKAFVFILLGILFTIISWVIVGGRIC